MTVRERINRTAVLWATQPSTPHPHPALSLPPVFAARVHDARARLLSGEPAKDVQRRHGAIVMRAAQYENL